MDFQSRLEKARNGGGILFCGAGFSTDCLNFDTEEIGTSGTLLALLNEKLQEKGHTTSPFKDLRNAAAEYQEREGESRLRHLLTDRFAISRVTDDMIDIVRFQWDRIYTTNYDNAIERAFTQANRPFKSFNNLEHKEGPLSKRTEIIHLHGCAEKWDGANFTRSCILSGESYFNLDGIRHWLEEFRHDIERASIVLFVGFSTQDFHLNEVLFNASSTQPKVFFVNRESAQSDPDSERTQKTFGTPLNIGRVDLAKLIREVAQTASPVDPVLRCYKSYEMPSASTEVPSVKDIEDLFIFGRFELAHLVRDMTQKKADYHVPRAITRKILSSIKDGAAIVLITGEICDGKTLVKEEICAQLSLSRPIFIMRHAYDDISEETGSILSASANAVVVIENCFDLSQERLVGLAQQFDKSHATLILTSRDIAAEAETAAVRRLEEFETLRRFRLGKLEVDEVDALIDLTDQIAGWRTSRDQTRNSQRRFVQNTCDGSLPRFLLSRLRSKYVKDRYAEEYRKTKNLNPNEIQAIITALYVAHIGYDAPLSFLSDVFQYDVGHMIDQLNNQNIAFKLVRRVGEWVQTVPSIGAENILKEVIEARDIVDAIVGVLNSLGGYPRGDQFSRHIFNQMMRYSILASVVDDQAQVDRFFNSVSKISYCRQQILFWLQWHMAKTDQKNFSDAEKYLQQAYAKAEERQRSTGRIYNKTQLDDRRAKFLVIRGRHEGGAMDDLFHGFHEAYMITRRLLHSTGLTHHPYDTLYEILRFLEVRGSRLNREQSKEVNAKLQELVTQAKKRIRDLEPGYQARRGQQVMQEFSQFQRN